jgi:type I restriction enzyme, S subunit
MKYKPYKKYKPSGIEWLGEIPEEWKFLYIKRLSRVKRGASPRPIDNPKFFDLNGEYNWVRISDVTNSDRFLIETEEKLSALGASLSVKLKKGDLFLSIAGSVGKVCITKIKCCIHDGFVYFPELKEDVNYFYYLFESGTLFLGLGKLGTQLNLNTDTVGSITIPLPPLSEQKSIADYLDKETAKIDNLINKQEKLIELLQEKREALISHTVTKGIPGKQRRMKSSGIEWLGGIPEEWEVKRLKNTTYIKARVGWQNLRSEEFSTDGILCITGTELKNGSIDYQNSYRVSERRFLQDTNIQLKNDDLLITKDGTIGKIAIISLLNEPATLNSGIFVTRPKHGNYIQKFMFWYLTSKSFYFFLSLMTSGSTINHLYQNVFENLPIPLPPLQEQKSIADFLDKETAKIDSLIEKAKLSIELSKEKRQALISSAVTGKIDVRGS